MYEKIGNVTLDTRFYGGDLYSDGDIEDTLLDIAENNDESEFDSIIAEKRNWAVFYHLSSHRRNIIEWIETSSNEDILEIGSGCGAVSGCLYEKGKTLDCVELSKKRSLINANRNKDKNINIFVGNFSDFYKQCKKKYDIITLIGVFEYAQGFSDAEKPYDYFLTQVFSLLKDGGRLILAIENKLGLKYWSGCREDHTGRLFDGIEDYAQSSGVKTFSKKELADMLVSAGFKDNTFYYPYPDYKFTERIYSDYFLPGIGDITGNVRNSDTSRITLFDESKAFDSIIKAGLFPEYSNSFLIIANKTEKRGEV